MLLQQYADNKRCIAANIRAIYVCRSESFERICSQQTAPPYRLYADDSCQPWQYAYTTGQSPKPVFVWQERDGYELFCSVDAPLFHHIISAYCYMAVWLCREGSDIVVTHSAANSEPDKKLIAMYGILFVACLLVVLRVLPYGVAFVAILVCTFFADRPTLGRVDYSLILTFVALFIFIGNLGRMEAFSGWLQNILAGHEVFVSVLASQVTSNVPAAILLSGFTDNFRALIIGTNLGGLGTLIASMASLISYRQIANEVPAEKGHYFAMFTISNVVFLAILMGAWALT